MNPDLYDSAFDAWDAQQDMILSAPPVVTPNEVLILRKRRWNHQPIGVGNPWEFTAFCKLCNHHISSTSTGTWAVKASAIKNAKLHLERHANSDLLESYLKWGSEIVEVVK